MKKLKERIKEFTNDTYGMLIFVSWIVLIVCLVIKIFGGNWFELGTENSKFIEFCTYVDETMWIKMILACLINVVSNYFVICLFLNKDKLNILQLSIFVPLLIIKSLVSWYNVVLSYLLDLITLIILPMVFGKFKNWKRVLIVNVLVFILQLITIIIRNLSFINFNLDNTFIGQVLYQVDYYILIILSYLYNTKKFFRKEN